MAFVAAMALMAGACGGGERTYEADEIGAIALQSDEPPAGMEYVGIAQGFTGQDGTPSDVAAERGLVSDFGSQFARPREAEAAPAEPQFVQSTVSLFRASEEAQRELDEFHTFVVDGDTFAAVRELESDGLGDAAHAFQANLAGSPAQFVVVFAWRRGNLLMNVVAGGSEDMEIAPVRALVDTMEDRAG